MLFAFLISFFPSWSFTFDALASRPSPSYLDLPPSFSLAACPCASFFLRFQWLFALSFFPTRQLSAMPFGDTHKQEHQLSHAHTFTSISVSISVTVVESLNGIPIIRYIPRWNVVIFCLECIEKVIQFFHMRRSNDSVRPRSSAYRYKHLLQGVQALIRARRNFTVHASNICSAKRVM